MPFLFLLRTVGAKRFCRESHSAKRKGSAGSPRPNSATDCGHEARRNAGLIEFNICVMLWAFDLVPLIVAEYIGASS